jgi:zinc protease
MKTRLLTIAAALCAILPAQVKLPPYEKSTLPNGATLILLRKADVPLITVRAMFRGGAEADPAGKQGLAAMTAELIRRGAGERTADEISEQLDSIGANLFTGANLQASFVAAECTTKTTDRCLEIIRDMIIRPTFPQAEFTKAIAQRVDAARSSKDNPGMAIQQYFGPFVYPTGHPYARPAMGDETVIAKLTLDDVKAYHRRMYTGKNLILIAAGDIDPKTFGPRLRDLFSGIPEGTRYEWMASPGPLKFQTSRLLLVDKPDATQTYFRIVMPGIERANPDRTALQLVNTLFGGRFTSMLNDELRVNSGLTYGAQSSIEQNRLSGALAINTYTRTDATEKAMDLALAILKRLRTQGIDAEQLQSAKNYIKGNFPTESLETADQIANILGEIEIYDLNRGEVDDLFSRIDSVTVAQANALAKKYYVEDNLQFLVIGAASKIQDTLKKYAPNMKVVSISDPGFQVPAF